MNNKTKNGNKFVINEYFSMLTGANDGFIATLINKTDSYIKITTNREDSFIVSPKDWFGILPGNNGSQILDSIIKSKYTVEPVDKSNLTCKYETMFDELLEMLDFSLIKNEKYTDEITGIDGRWSLEDDTGANLGNIEGDRFNNANEIFGRLETYIEDYIIKYFEEEYGVDVDDFDYWEDFVTRRDMLPEGCRWGIDYLDMICNHFDEIDLNFCKHKKKEQFISIDGMITAADKDFKATGIATLKGIENHSEKLIEDMGDIEIVDHSLKKYIGKKIMAYEDIYQFSTGTKVSSRGRSIGIVAGIDSEKVQMFDSSNPKGYEKYTLKTQDFLKWISEGLYVSKTAPLFERLETINTYNSEKTEDKEEQNIEYEVKNEER